MEIPNKINEESIKQKKATLINVSKLKQAGLPLASSNAQTQIDPEISKQNDLDNLTMFDYKAKYGFNSDSGVEYVRNQSIKNKAQYEVEQQQKLADSHDLVDQGRDVGVALGAGLTNLAGGTTGAVLMAASDPVQAVGALGDVVAGGVASFVGKKDGYEDIKENVSTFLKERGVAVKAKEDPKLDGVFAPSLSKQFLDVISETSQQLAGNVFQGTKAVTDWIKQGHSDALDAKTAVRQQENQEYKTRLKAELGEDASGWEHALANTRIGGNAFINLLKDPSATSIVIAESVPSLWGAGKVSSALTEKAYKTAVTQESLDILKVIQSEGLSHKNTHNLINVKLKEVADNATKINLKDKANTLDVSGILASGALEGAGAGSEAYNLIIDSDYNTLAKTSDRYNELLGGKLGEVEKEDARRQLAIESSLSAGMGVLLLAGATAKVFKTSDGINRVGGTVKTAEGVMPRAVQMSIDSAREGGEELFQSFIGASATGLVERANIDPNKDVFADASIAAGEGSIAGVGTSLALGTPSLIKEVGKKAQHGIKNTALPTEKIKAIKKNGVTVNDLDVTAPGFDLVASVIGIEERNAVEGVAPQELADNYNEANQLINDQVEVLVGKEVEYEKNPSKLVAKEIEQISESIIKASNSTALMEARLVAIKATMNGDSEAAPLPAAERTLKNIADAPDTVPEEEANSLLESGSLSQSETAQVEAHIQYVRDAKSVAEVNSDVLSGGKGFIGIKQHMRNIASAISVNQPERANAALNKLKQFAARHAQKSRDFSEGLAIARTKNPTPQQVARLQEINATYPNVNPKYATIHGGTPDSVVDIIRTEANALDSAVKLATLNIEGTTPIIKEEAQDVQGTSEKVESVPETTETQTAEEIPRVPEKQEQTTEVITEETFLKGLRVSLNKVINSLSAGGAKNLLTDIYQNANLISKANRTGEDVFVDPTVPSSLDDIINLRDLPLDELIQEFVNESSKEYAEEDVQIAVQSAIKVDSAQLNLTETEATETTSVVEESVEVEDLVTRKLRIEARLEEIQEEVGNTDDIPAALEKEGILLNEELLAIHASTSEINEEASEPESAVEVLGRAIKGGQYKGTAREIIAKAILKALSPNVIVQIVPSNSPQLLGIATNDYYPGMYYEGGEVFISDSLSQKEFDEVILHELIHAVLVPAYKTTPNKTAAEKKFINEIQKLHKFMIKQAEIDGVSEIDEIAYGLQNVDEFLAMAMSNKIFMQWMTDTEIAGKSILSRFAQMVSELLGINKNYYSALENILDISDQVLNSAPLKTETAPVANKTIADVEPVAIKEVNILENTLGTQETAADVDGTYEGTTPADRLKTFSLENLVKKYFRPKNKTGVTKNPLLSVQDFMSVLLTSPVQMITRFTEIKEVTNKQLQLVVKLEDHRKSFTASLLKVFKSSDKLRGRDMIQYLSEDGSIPEFIQSAMAVATYNWASTKAGDTVFNTDEDIRKILGLEPTDPITPAMYENLRTGGFRGNISAEIGKDILKIIGIEALRTAPGNMQPQLEDSLGLLAIAAMNQQGLVTLTRFQSKLVFPNADEETKIHKITAATVKGEEFNELHPLLADYAESVKDTGQLLSMLFSVKANTKGPLKSPSKNVVKVVQGTAQKISKKYRDVIRKHQKLKHYLKREQVEQFLALTPNTQRAMLGYTFDMDSVHVKRKDSVEGANRSINASIMHMMDFLAENNNDEPFYFNHAVIKNGRLLLESNTFNPQNDKLHRHMMKITGQESTIDFRSEDPTQLTSFLIAFGQGMGISIDKQLQVESLAQVRKLVKDPVIVEAIKAINSKDGTYTSEQEAAILAGIKKGGEKTWSFDALVAYAAYDIAKRDGTTFTHDLMVEADGITNGPGIATVQFGIGSSDDKVLRLKKSGMNSNGDVEEYGKWISTPGNHDNYETITLELNDKTKDLEGSNLTVANFTKFLLGDLTTVTDGNEISWINRNISKNPLMTTIYGAGKKSTRDSIGKATVEAIYQYLEDNANNPEALDILAKHLKQTFYINIKPSELKNALTLELSNTIEEAISNKVGNVIGKAMIEAIDEHYGQFKEGTVVINEAMGRVAEVFQEVFQHAVEQRTNELADQGILARGRNGDMLETLPKDEIDKILTKLVESQPIMQSVLSSQNDNATDEGLFVGKINNVASSQSALQTTQTYNKDAGLKLTNLDEKGNNIPYSSGSMFAQVKEYISGGTSPVVLAVQNIDATTMLEHLNEFDAFNVYDAIIVGVDGVERKVKNINGHFYEINKNHSIAVEALKAFDRAELAAKAYDKEHGTKFSKQFTKITERGFGKDKVKVNVKELLADTTKTTEEARLDTVGLITHVGQYGWENSAHVVSDDNTPLVERSLGNTPDAVDGKYHTEAEIEVNKMSVLEVFDNLLNMGNKMEDKEHSSFLRESLNTLKSQILNPITLHLGDVLKHKDAKGNDTLANITGSDIYMYTQMFGGQPGSTAILNAGLRMSAQEALAHEMWHGVSRHGIEGNNVAKKELNQYWEKAKKVITPFDLMDDPTLGKNSPEYAQAQDTWNYIFVSRIVETKVIVNPVTGQAQTKSYSNHLHEFAAYSMTNAKFIKALKQVPADTKGRTEVRQDDGSFLNSVYNKILDLLGKIVDMFTVHLTNTKGLTQDLAVRELVKQLSNIEAQNKNAILSTIDVAGKAAGKMAGIISATTKVITKPIVQLAESKMVRDSKSAFIRLPGRIVRLRNQNAAVSVTFDALNTVTRNLNSKKEGFVEQLVTEAQGLTDKFKNFHTLSRMKTKMIDGAVVETEAAIITELNKAFGTTDLTEYQRKAITKAFLKTDLSSLNLNQNQLLDLLNNPTRVPSLIAKIESNLANDPNVNHYILQAKALGHHMATGRVTSSNQNYNAQQIVRLFGTTKVRKAGPAGVVKAVDQLATLYALQDTDSSYKIALSELIKSEQAKGDENGMTYLQAFHNKQKEVDAKEIFSGSEVNMVKGHLREEYDPNIQSILLTEIDGAVYEARGWVKGIELFKDPADPSKAPLYLYTNKYGGQTNTITGIISLTSRQARGSDTVKIRQTFGDSSPVQGGAQDATRINNVKSRMFAQSLAGAATFNASKAPSQMAPLFDLAGNITGYRYLMNDKTKDTLLERNNDAIRVLAKGAAGTVNKVNSAELNKRAIEAMKLQFDTEPNSNYLEFGPGSTDAEIRELYRLLPKEAKDAIQTAWGSNTMFVDRKVITMMFGYRKFSIADALAKDKLEQNLATQWLATSLNLLGKPFNLKAEQIARTTGMAWQEFVSASKDFIVIKSGIVTAANTVSNGIQLFTEGVSPINILKYQKEAAVELAKYRQQRAELFELEKKVELGVQANQLGAQKARIAQIESELTANPITDVVEDGLLQTIVEDVSLVDDQFTLAGKGKAILDKHVFTKVPGYVREVANEAFQTKESFLYKKMAQSAQLSDFVARYALYQHNINHKNPKRRLSREDAANNAISTFINYDLPTHRLIQYGNDMGFLWFTKYYIRIQKILLTTLVKQPLRVISTILGDFFSGDALSNMYDSTLTPENVGNRVRFADSPFEMVSNLALAKVI